METYSSQFRQLIDFLFNQQNQQMGQIFMNSVINASQQPRFTTKKAEETKAVTTSVKSFMENPIGDLKFPSNFDLINQMKTSVDRFNLERSMNNVNNVTEYYDALEEEEEEVDDEDEEEEDEDEDEEEEEDEDDYEDDNDYDEEEDDEEFDEENYFEN